MTEHNLRVTEADLSRADHQAATIELLNGYAMDPMGNGRPLSEEVKQALIPGLRQHPTTTIFLAYQADTPIAIAACFLGFSTFAARPLLNIHDFFVVPSSRGTGVGRHLMAAVERRARELGCCKLTLEVQENNHRARKIYANAGFAQATYVAESGGAFSDSKSLTRYHMTTSDRPPNSIRWPTPNKTSAVLPDPDTLVIAWKPIIDGWDIVRGRAVADSPEIYTHWLPMIPQPDEAGL